MLNATVEMFMSEYFLIKTVIGKYLSDSKALFQALSKICLIPIAKVDELYDLAENDTAKNITTEKEFMQHQRVQKYSQLIGTANTTNEEWEEIAQIKGNAILIAQRYQLLPDVEASRNVVYTYLSTATTNGTVCALRIMGILQCEGIFLDKNEKEGIKKLSKSADWNDGISILALLHYCSDKRAYNMARLRQVIKDTPFSSLYGVAVEKYCSVAESGVEGVNLLNKAFCSGVLKRECYDSIYARILNSKALSVKDKEKALFSQIKEQLSVIGDLPLKLSSDNITAVNVDKLEQVALKRKAEFTYIGRALKNSDLRELPSYKPLCICADSKYLLNTYARAIASKNESVHVETIDVAELIEYDFEPTPNNVFVRSIDEDKDNRFLLFFCGNVSERRVDAVKSILQSARRTKYHLNSPNVTLNLSAVLPICFCDTVNAELLRPYCDIIKLAPVTEEEFPIAIRDILATKEKLYGIGKIRINEELSETFSGYDIDTAEKLIDSAVRSRREKGANITLSHDMLQQYISGNDRPKIGFGGGTDARNH